MDFHRFQGSGLKRLVPSSAAEMLVLNKILFDPAAISSIFKDFRGFHEILLIIHLFLSSLS